MGKEFPLESHGFHPFGSLIGLEFTRVAAGYSRCELTVGDALMNPDGVLHGGVLASMADTGMGAALYTTLENDEACATIEMKINYLRPVAAGVVVCETRLVYRGGSTAYLESSLRVDSQEIRTDTQEVARATGTFYLFTEQ